jgi:squalene-hopene/tetraprenyl-beta-curcumene cyclase
MPQRILALMLFTTCFLAAADLPNRAEVAKLTAQAQAWLLRQQQENGAFLPGERFSLGVTTVAVNALLDSGMDPNDPRLVKAGNFILGYVQPDGGIYNPQEGLANYGTSMGLQALMGMDKADPELVKRAQNYLLGIQNTDENSVSYGGIGYGGRGEGNEDLSNTATAIEALKKSGIPADHPAMQRAMKFLERTQNLSSHNDLPHAGNDGGAYYSPDSSMARGSFREGRVNAERPASDSDAPTELNSYGSMTYQLIFSYIYLDLKPGDPRLDAALRWVTENYQFAVNPGMPEGQTREGLFYYYRAMAKTFDLLEKTTVTDGGENLKGDWRADLFASINERAQIVSAEKAGGVGLAFWINDQPRWAEGIPHLATAYMLGCLGRIQNSLPE